MAYEILGMRPKQIDKLIKRKYLIPTSEPNRLFDLMAERGVDYKMNIPRSKFHNGIVKLMTFEKAMYIVYGTEFDHTEADWSNGTIGQKVLLLEYDKAFCKNPRYLRTYLQKQISE